MPETYNKNSVIARFNMYMMGGVEGVVINLKIFDKGHILRKTKKLNFVFIWPFSSRMQ